MIGILRTMAMAAVMLCTTAVMNCANAQDVRYSWFEFGALGQDIQKMGSSFDPDLNQSIDINATDGGGVRFRGSVGTWKNFYVYFNFESTDPTVEAVITNIQATDRAFRIGQKRNVLVHKFVCSGTIEEKIDALIEEKTQLSAGLLEGGTEKMLTEMSDRDLIKLVSLDMERAGF